MAGKRGQSFLGPHKTLNVYLPRELFDRLETWAKHRCCSRSSLIRAYVEAALNDAEVDAVVKAKQAKVLR